MKHHHSALIAGMACMLSLAGCAVAPNSGDGSCGDGQYGPHGGGNADSGSVGATGGTGGATGGTGGTTGEGSGKYAKKPEGACKLTGWIETEPNDARDTPTAMVVNSTLNACLDHQDDVDHHRFTIPEGPPGGRALINFRDVGDCTVTFELWAGDQRHLTDGSSDARGAGEVLWFEAMSGHSYYAKVSHYWTGEDAACPYSLELTYERLPEEGAPNPDQSSARAITLGTPVNSYYFEGIDTPSRSPNRS